MKKVNKVLCVIISMLFLVNNVAFGGGEVQTDESCGGVAFGADEYAGIFGYREIDRSDYASAGF